MKTIDEQYIDLMRHVIDNGNVKKTRNGNTKSIFGYMLTHDMRTGYPLITTRKMPFKYSVLPELLWFISGQTRIKPLLDKKCNIWNGDCYESYRKTMFKLNLSDDILEYDSFIDKVKNEPEFEEKWGDLGKIYGYQWRNFGGIDQFKELIENIKNDCNSRRLIVNSWNVPEIQEAVLPPCHVLFQLYANEIPFIERLSYVNEIDYSFDLDDDVLDVLGIPKHYLSLQWYQRSVDIPLGLPTNIASYALLLIMIARETNTIPLNLNAMLGDTHIYENQIENAIEQIGRYYTHEERCEMNNLDSKLFSPLDLDKMNYPRKSREPMKLPKIEILSDKNIFELTEDDIKLVNYVSHPTIKYPLSN
jgi:thymidylate synthase